MLITTFQRGCSVCFMSHLRKHFPACLAAQHQTPVSTLFMNMPTIVLRNPTVCSINQSIQPKWVCDILHTKVDFDGLRMSLQKQIHTAAAQRATVCLESKWSAACQPLMTSSAHRNQAVSCTINPKEAKTMKLSIKTKREESPVVHVSRGDVTWGSNGK